MPAARPPHRAPSRRLAGLIFLVCLTLAGCGGSAGSASAPSPTPAPAATVAQTETPARSATPAQTSTPRPSATLPLPSATLPLPSATPAPAATATGAAPTPASLTDLSGVWAVQGGPEELRAPGDGTTPVASLVEQGPRLHGTLFTRYARYELAGTYAAGSGAATLTWLTLRAGRANAQGTLAIDGAHLSATFSDLGGQGSLALLRLGVPGSPAAARAFASLRLPTSFATPTEVRLPTPVPTGYIDGPWEWGGTAPFAGQGPAVFSLHKRADGTLAGVVSDPAGERFAVTGTYTPASGAVTLQWAVAAGLCSFTGTVDSSMLTIQGSWSGPTLNGGASLARPDRPPPTPAPPQVGTPAPTATLFVPPTAVPAGYVDGIWQWTGTGPDNFMMHGATFLTLHKRPDGTLTGVLTDGLGERFLISGTYNQVTRAISLGWAMTQGAAGFSGTVDAAMLTMNGIWSGFGFDGGSGFARVRTPGPLAAATAAAQAHTGPTPTVFVPPTPIPVGQIGGTWQWTGTGPDSFTMHGPTFLTLQKRRDGSLTGVLKDPAGDRFAVSGSYTPANGAVLLRWAAPSGSYSFSGTVATSMLSMEGIWGGPEGDGGSGFSRVTSPAPPAPAPSGGGPAAATPTLFVPPPTATVTRTPTPIPAGDLAGAWAWTGPGPGSLPVGTQVLTLRRLPDGTLRGVLAGATGDRFAISGTYAPASRVIDLVWAMPSGLYHLQGTVSADMLSITGGWTGPAGTGGIVWRRVNAQDPLLPTPVPPGQTPGPTATLFLPPSPTAGTGI